MLMLLFLGVQNEAKKWSEENRIRTIAAAKRFLVTSAQGVPKYNIAPGDNLWHLPASSVTHPAHPPLSKIQKNRTAWRTDLLEPRNLFAIKRNEENRIRTIAAAKLFLVTSAQGGPKYNIAPGDNLWHRVASPVTHPAHPPLSKIQKNRTASLNTVKTNTEEIKNALLRTAALRKRSAR
jgi:hypothetical protein